MRVKCRADLTLAAGLNLRNAVYVYTRTKLFARLRLGKVAPAGQQWQSL